MESAQVNGNKALLVNGILQAPVVPANEGTRHCGRAMYCFSASPSGLSQWGLTTLRVGYIIWQQAQAVLANKGTRHRGQATYCFQQAPAVLANKGSQHCRRATSFDSKPQQSWPRRAWDIAGKLRQWWQLCKRALMGWCTTIKRQASKGHGQKAQDHGKLLIFSQQAKWRSRHEGINFPGKLTFWTGSPSGLGQSGYKALRASCIVLPQALAVLATEGTSCLVGGWQSCKRRWRDGAQPCQKLPQQEDFFAGKATAGACVNLDTKVDATGHSHVKKIQCTRGWSLLGQWSTT